MTDRVGPGMNGIDETHCSQTKPQSSIFFSFRLTRSCLCQGFQRHVGEYRDGLRDGPGEASSRLELLRKKTCGVVIMICYA